MTYAERWQRRQDGRALIQASASGQWLLWLAQLGEHLVLVDDSIGGHLVEVDPSEDEEIGITRWKRLQGAMQGRQAGPGRRPGPAKRTAWVNPRAWPSQTQNRFDTTGWKSESELLTLHG